MKHLARLLHRCRIQDRDSGRLLHTPRSDFLTMRRCSAVRIHPCIVGVVKIIHASSIAGDSAHAPVVSAEMKGFGGSELRCANALDDAYQDYRTALRRRYIDGWRRTVARVD